MKFMRNLSLSQRWYMIVGWATSTCKGIFRSRFRLNSLPSLSSERFAQTSSGYSVTPVPPPCWVDPRRLAPGTITIRARLVGQWIILTRKRYWSPYTIEFMVRTGFQSSLRILRQTFPSRSMFGWYTFVSHFTWEIVELQHGLFVILIIIIKLIIS